MLPQVKKETQFDIFIPSLLYELVSERSSGVSSIDDLEKFASARVQNNAPRVPSRDEGVKTSATRHGGSSEDDLDFIFNTGFRSNSVPKSRVKNAVRKRNFVEMIYFKVSG